MRERGGVSHEREGVGEREERFFVAAIKNAEGKEGGRERVAPISKSRGEESLKRGGVSGARGRVSMQQTCMNS